MQALFSYDDHTLAALQRTVSSARLQRYIKIATGDLVEALQLYTWNTALSEALYVPLQGLEITLRNVVHESLTRAFGQHWYDHSGLGLRYVQKQRILEAKASLRLQRKALEPGRIVAELNFGFWVGLFSSKYETNLWRPHLRTVFGNAPTPFLRKTVHRALDDIRLLRNRIAHHESILQRPLRQEHELILGSVRWMCDRRNLGIEGGVPRLPAGS
jgi:hypothetical protein